MHAYLMGQMLLWPQLQLLQLPLWLLQPWLLLLLLLLLMWMRQQLLPQHWARLRWLLGLLPDLLPCMPLMQKCAV